METDILDAKLLFSAREAAAMLGISERTLWTITFPRGSLRCVRPTNSRKSRLLYSSEALQAWVREREQCNAA